jgi:uncharacterized protein YggE
MRRPSSILLALVASQLWHVGCPLYGAEANRLAVTGIGRVDVRPDVMELSATVSGSAELSSDALKKFRNNRRRGIEAINKLKIDRLNVKGTGASVLSNAAMQQYQQRFGGNQQFSPGQTTFSETLTFEVPGIDRLTDEQVQDLATKVLDAAKDAGLTMGQSVDPGPYYNYNSYRPQIVFFRIAHPDEAKLKALDEAAHDARKKADQIAKQLKLSIGNTVSARDAGRNYNAAPNVYPNQQTTPDLANALHPITVEAALSVEYEIRTP